MSGRALMGNRDQSMFRAALTGVAGVVAGIVAGLIALAAIAAFNPAWAQLEPHHAGHWHSPALPGQGIVISAWPDQPHRPAGAVVVLFNYEPGGPGQVWLISDVLEAGQRTVDVYLPAGAWPGVEHQLGERVGAITIGPPFAGGDGLRMYYHLPAFPDDCDPLPQPSPRPPDCQGVIHYQRLTPPGTVQP